MRPIEIACGQCASQPGEDCKPVDETIWKDGNWLHSTRIIDAASMSATTSNTPTVEEFNKAVEGLDII